MEKLIKELLTKSIDYKITVENLKVESPYLENLIFNLDSIDVKDLSGTLTIGNNFGIPIKNKLLEEQKEEQENNPKKKHTIVKKKHNNEKEGCVDE